MSEAISVVSEAIALLDATLGHDDAEAMTIALRALQRMGLSREDLIVHIERRRLINEFGARDESLEDRLLLALDMIHGLAGDLSLEWDSHALAGAYLRSVLIEEDLTTSIAPALARNDMLPPRLAAIPIQELIDQLSQRAQRLLSRDVPNPTEAQFIRVPKSGFTSRPAALLAPLDRVWWEALGDLLGDRLNNAAPEGVMWPRDRAIIDFSAFVQAPQTWGQAYVVRTDIESFYESIDHSILGLALTSLGASSRYARAVEAFLDVVMGSRTGLPQGPPASELFSSAFLLLVDQRLEESGQTFVRFADDYAFPAESMADAREIIEKFEALLREVGLRLHSAKTKILRSSTYEANMGGKVSPRIEALRRRLRSIARTKLLETEEPDDIEARLLEIGVGEEIIFDLLYHRTLSMAELLRQIEPLLDPTLVKSYRTFFIEEADRYRQGLPPENRLSSQADLKEALLYLAGAKERVPNSALRSVLEWNPTLAPSVAIYLNEVAIDREEGVRRFVGEWLRGSSSDWVRAWGCYVAECNPHLVDDSLLSALQHIAIRNQRSPLSRAGATRALAARGVLTDPVWELVLAESSQPMRSEFILDRISNPAAYRHVAGGEVEGAPSLE